MKDRFDKEIQLGDKVLFVRAYKNYASVDQAVVVALTAQRVRVLELSQESNHQLPYIDEWSKTTVTRTVKPENLIVIKELSHAYGPI